MTNVLTGSVRRSGNRIRITVQLASAADGFSLWSEQYDRELVDVFAVELDPLNAHALAILGQTFMGVNRLPEALNVLRRAKELDPTLFHPRSHLVRLYVLESRGAEAVEEAETEVEALGRNPWTLPTLAAALSTSGRVIEAEHVLKELVDLSDQHYVSPFLIAGTSAWVGRREDAFQWLDRAYRERDPVLGIYCSCFYWTEEFCDDPRFRELRKRMGLE